MRTTAVKALDEGSGRVGGYLIAWGGPQARDLHGEYFTHETALALDWFERRPALYHHGLDGTIKAALVGVIDTLRCDDLGLWAEAQLDLRERYVQAVYTLVQAGKLAWSSGSLPHLVEVAADGRILRWPLVEGSLTPSPAEPRRTSVQTLKSAYVALGLDAARLEIPEAMNLNGGKQTMNETTTTQEAPVRKRLPLDASEAGPRIDVGSPYDRLGADDLLHGYMLLRANPLFRGVSERYANALAHKVQRAQLSAIKADELSHSTQAAYGDDWVPDLWSAQLWQRVQQENVILPLFRSIEMPSNPFELPIDGADPVVYYVAETSDRDHLTLGAQNRIPDSKIGSAKVQMNARKLALRVGFSSELVEDSVVPLLAIYREQAARAIADAVEGVLLNGDTSTGGTGNINSDHAAPPSGAPYLALDGLRKQPLVTTAANKVDMAAASPTLAKLREARFKLAARYAARPSDLAWIVDAGTYARLLDLDAFLTMDKAGPLATAQTGQIGFMDGIPVLLSAQMALTEADGKVGAGPNNRGSALCVYRPGWYVGYRRQITVNVEYLSYMDSYQMTATLRLAFVHNDGASADVTSLLYNIAV